MKRFFYVGLSALGFIFFVGLAWITIQDLFLSDPKHLVHDSAVIYTVRPNYSVNPPSWTIESIIKGQSDVRFKMTPGTAFSSAPTHFPLSGQKPDQLLVFCSPRYLFWGPLQTRCVVSIYEGKIPAFDMTYEQFTKQFFPST